MALDIELSQYSEAGKLANDLESALKMELNILLKHSAIALESLTSSSLLLQTAEIGDRESIRFNITPKRLWIVAKHSSKVNFPLTCFRINSSLRFLHRYLKSKTIPERWMLYESSIGTAKSSYCCSDFR